MNIHTIGQVFIVLFGGQLKDTISVPTLNVLHNTMEMHVPVFLFTVQRLNRQSWNLLESILIKLACIL